MKALTIQNPDVAVKLTRKQAEQFGINPDVDEVRGELKTRGMWNVPVSFKALCSTAKFGKYSSQTEITLFGQRTMTDVRQGGYELEGRVSIGGKKYTCFTSSQLFQVEGRLINVDLIHARYK